jgi:hypothetical protein
LLKVENASLIYLSMVSRLGQHVYHEKNIFQYRGWAIHSHIDLYHVKDSRMMIDGLAQTVASAGDARESA